jgi:hypothetical protein
MVLMAVRYDHLEKVKEVEQLVDDICLELEDELPVEVKPYFSKEQDYLSLDIRIPDSKSIKYSNEVNYLLTEVSERIKDYMKSQNYNFKYIIKYRVRGPLFYNGNAGRFGTEIIDAAKEYSRRHDEDTDKPLWSRYYKTLNVEKLSMNYTTNDKLTLTGSDLDTLLSDLDNCTKSWSLNADLEENRNREFPSPTIQNGIKERNKVTEILLKLVLIEFRKV